MVVYICFVELWREKLPQIRKILNMPFSSQYFSEFLKFCGAKIVEDAAKASLVLACIQKFTFMFCRRNIETYLILV